MVDQWYYRMFDEEFGPVSLEKLKELTECGTLSPSDEVRPEGSVIWVIASSLEQLGFHDGMSTGSTNGSGSSADIDVQANRAANDTWYCKIGGNEFGPWTFDELAEYAKNEQLSADDEVKLGESGKWRRVGSIGRLMALLPYKAIEKNIVPTPPKPVVVIQEEEMEEVVELPEIYSEDTPDIDEWSTEDTPNIDEWSAPDPSPAPVAQASVAAAVEANAVNNQAAFQAAYEQAKAKIAESMIAQAEAAFKTAEDQAKQSVAWATAANVDKFWFGWASGVEFGPVEFNQVFGLAKSGQLKPTDFVRNGQFAQFAPASNVPGLFTAVAQIAKATEVLTLAKSQALAAVSLAGPSAMPAILPTPVTPAPAPAPMSRSSASIPTMSASTHPAGGGPKSNPSMPVVRNRSTGSDPEIASKKSSEDDEWNSLLNESAPISMSGESGGGSGRSDSRSSMEPRDSSSESRGYSNSSSPYSSSPMGGGISSSTSTMASMSSMSSSSYAASRPVAPPPKAYPKKSRPSASESTFFSDMKEHLKEPKVIGSLCTIAFLMLLFGWPYLPKSRGADIKRYKMMKEAMDEVRSKRSNPGELKAIETKLTKMGKEIAAELKDKAGRDDPAKQCLLWAARDEIPRWVKSGTMATEGSEKALESRLREASYELGLEKRPPVDPSALAQARLD